MAITQRPYQYQCDCDGMVKAVRRAADATRWNGPDPSLGDMTLQDQAVWWVKYCVRKARRLKLYGGDSD